MHLTLRVAWHDSGWNGTVCRDPAGNPFCLSLDRIRTEKKDGAEIVVAGRHFADLPDGQLPPCRNEAAAFMSPRDWLRVFKHPYQELPKTRDTHGHLRPTPHPVPAYSAFGVPFWWMHRNNQTEIDSHLPEPLPPDSDPPFDSPWVFGRARQEAITDLFFGRLTDNRSLVFFYAKEGHPLDEGISRLVVGVGTITKIGKVLKYQTDGSAKPPYPIWDRLIRHSIRPDGSDGFLLPYHAYLAPTGDPEEDERRRGLLDEIAVAAPREHIRTFSFMAEHADADVALSMLTRCMAAVRLVKAHGIAAGPWDEREDWLNAQIAAAWRERGAFPGVGAALEAIGLRLGTALALELLASGQVKADDNPWPVLDAILRGDKKAPRPVYQGDVDAVRRTWAGLADQRRALLQLLSRFTLTAEQAKRWFEPKKRPGQLADGEVLANPYRIAELDLGDGIDGPIAVGTVDRGLLPDATIAARHPVPAPSTVQAQLDERRVRAVLVAVLREAAAQGDTLLSETETLSRVPDVDLPHPCDVTADWIQASTAYLGAMIERQALPMPRKAGDGADAPTLAALQLVEYKQQEDELRKILNARSGRPLPSTGADWRPLIQQAIAARGGKFDPTNPRHTAALEEQATALEQVTTRKLSVLTGRAGTGKTSALGALLLSPLQNSGILLLAPTGKARVMLSHAAGSEAMTIAQFLYRLDRYDGARQRPLFDGPEKYHQEKTVVIDECSMVTLDTLYAVLQALDLVHVDRLILVGDPNQLPPIGVGRPFADLCAHLEALRQSTAPADQARAAALGRLTVEVRTAPQSNEQSDTLRLASWFTREAQLPDADKVFSDLAAGAKLNDVALAYWKTPDELREALFQAFQDHLRLAAPDDVLGFDKALGLNEKRWVPFEKPEGAENFQILSPVRMHPYGIYDLNRLIQTRFRGPELTAARTSWKTRLGDEDIVIRDKVIQVRNQRRRGYNNQTKEQDEYYLANGEIGICSSNNGKFLNVVFSGRPWLTFGYGSFDFPQGAGPLELAYALTVHKAQGSEFKKTFVVLPKHCRLLTRELLYTALTRSREQLVLLIEGEDGDYSPLYEFSRPETSEVVRRNSNLFQAVLRVDVDEVPYAEHLIHRTQKGHMMRSKSELVIADTLHHLGIPYQYEAKFEGTIAPGLRRPDFLFADPAGEAIIWEHLGMLSRDDYRRSWELKRQWYLQNGFVEGATMFTTEDDERGGLDSTVVRKLAEHVKSIL